MVVVSSFVGGNGHDIPNQIPMRAKERRVRLSGIGACGVQDYVGTHIGRNIGKHLCVIFLGFLLTTTNSSSRSILPLTSTRRRRRRRRNRTGIAADTAAAVVVIVIRQEQQLNIIPRWIRRDTLRNTPLLPPIKPHTPGGIVMPFLPFHRNTVCLN